MTDVAARARRLARWYPGEWRAAHADEFCALLEDDLAARPRSASRALDVARCGLAQRVRSTGLSGPLLAPAEQARRSLGWLAASAVAFGVVGVSLWSQLLVSWQWAAPPSPLTTTGTLAMSLCLLGLALVGAVALVPVASAVALALWRPGRSRLFVPLCVLASSLCVLVVGAHRFEDGWPGTGGHHRWPDQGLAPGGVAAFAWAATLSLSTYWAHPAELSRFPSAEVAWMATSLVAIIALVASAGTTVRRVELSPRGLRAELRCARVAGVALLGFLLGALAWLWAGTPSTPGLVRHDLFHVGAIDAVGAAAMVVALALYARALRRGESALLLAPA